MKSTLVHVHFLAAAVALHQLSGCAPMAPQLDSRFGESLNTLKAYQTLNPDAAANLENPRLDGAAAMEANGRYLKSFSAPAPHQNVFTIGVGHGAQ